jgi:hypothetical protein
MVTVGWKPSLSKAAADTVTTINKEVERGDQAVARRERAEQKNSNAKKENNTSQNTDAQPNLGEKTRITPARGYRKKSTLKDKF